MSSSGKNLDPAKKGVGRSSGAAAPRTHTLYIDLDELPEDLAAAYVESQKPYRHDAKTRKAISRRRYREEADRKRAWCERIKAGAKKGVWRTDSGRGARILELAADWITAYELRTAMNVYRGAVQQVLDRLWRRGELLKRKNPAWSGKPGWGVGVARCEYQYRSVQVGNAPERDKDESR